MSKKALKLAGRRPMLLAVIMTTLTLGLLFSGWLTPTPGRAQPNAPNPQSNVEATNSCGGTTYDPATQGCCGGTVYDLATQGCCTHCTYDSGTQTITCTHIIYDLATQCCFAPDGSVVSKFNIADLSKCPDRTTRPPPYDPADGENGCGAATGISSITPNCPSQVTSPACTAAGDGWCFLNACNSHDKGYGTCNVAKDDTDQQFFNDMTDVCDGLTSPVCRTLCRVDAGIYYDAVHYGGGSAYDDAQKAACICCP